MVALVGTRGYRQTELATVLEAAEVRREAFHRHFADMEQCFLALWDEMTLEHAQLAGEAFARPGCWRDRLRAVAWVTLDYLQHDLARTRFLVIEVLNAGEMAQAHRDLAIQAEVEWVDAGRQELPDPSSMSRATAESIVGAINELLIRTTLSGEILHGERVVRELMYMAVRPYLGRRAAREELSIPSPRLSPQTPGSSR